MRNPGVAIAVLLIVLFFPLNLLDYLIWVIVNLGVAIINAIMWIIVMIVNGIIWTINEIFSILEAGLESIGIDVGDVPGLEKLSYMKQEWIDVNIFSPTSCLFTIILELVGISFPIW